MASEMNDKEFDEMFMALEPHTLSTVVETILGLPDEDQEHTVPRGSGWGTQDSFAIKIKARRPYLEWVYHRGKIHYLIWFAKVKNGWAITFRGPIEKWVREKVMLPQVRDS